MKNIISIFMSIISSIIFFLFGDINFIFKALLTLMVMDFATGIIKSYINKEISSKTSFKVLLKKFGYLIIVSTASLLDRILNTNDVIRNLTIYSLLFSEMISIIENWALIGIKLLNKLVDFLRELHDKVNSSNEK